MQRVSYIVTCSLFILGVSSGMYAQSQAQPEKQSEPQKKSQQAQQKSSTAKQVTLSGCLRQASDSEKTFALVDPKPAGTTQKADQPTGTAGTAGKWPVYRIEDPGTPALEPHVGKRVEISGTMTPAKDEKGADIVTWRGETIGVDTMTITAIDLKPAPRLDVKSVRAVGNCPAPKAGGDR